MSTEYSAPEGAIQAGKDDEYCQAVGSFSVYQMPDTRKYDYFPIGQPPQRDGEKLYDAVYCGTWSYDPSRKWWEQEEYADDDE